jgi:hypothetical protein
MYFTDTRQPAILRPSKGKTLSRQEKNRRSQYEEIISKR